MRVKEEKEKAKVKEKEKKGEREGERCVRFTWQVFVFCFFEGGLLQGWSLGEEYRSCPMLGTTQFQPAPNGTSFCPKPSL